MRLSVVIPTAGKRSRLSAVLRSLSAQDVPPGLEWDVAIVADGVRVELPDALDLPVAVVVNPVALGRGAARNRGISRSSADVVVLLDDDIVVTPSFLRAHVAAQSRGGALCRGPIRELPLLVHAEELDPLRLAPGLSEQAARRVRRPVADLVAALADPGRCWEQHGKPSRLELVGGQALAEGERALAWLGFAGANLSAPRSWFLDGPFDERPGTRWGLEDLSLSLRWSLLGRPLVEAPEARGLHLTHPRASWKDDLAGTLCCLDFVPASQREAILKFLVGDATSQDLAASLAPLWSVETSRREQET